MPISEELEKRVDAQVEALKGLREIPQGVALGLKPLVETAVWWVAVVSPGFLGLLWDAKELFELSSLSGEQFYLAFALAELSFLVSIVGSMIVHSRANHIIGTNTEHTLHLTGIINSFLSAKSSGEVPEGAQAGLDAFLVKYYEMEADLNRGQPMYVRAAERVYRPAGVLGYLVVALIILTFKFGKAAAAAALYPNC
jgi:hypothetical protein